MREKLSKLEGERTEWIGTFARYGRKTAFRGPPLQTVLLTDILDAAGTPACDHLWFNFTKEFAALELQAGERVKFTARVQGYWKGYGGPEDQTRDLKLARPTNIRRVDAKPAADLPLFLEGNQMRLL